MKKSRFIAFMVLLFPLNVFADTLSIEQTAFNYFISILDSVKIFRSDTLIPFDKSINKIYFNGKASCCLSLDFRLYDYRAHKPFVEIDSMEDVVKKHNPWIYSDSITTEITFVEPFIVISNYKKFKRKGKEGDIHVSISSRFHHRDFYYVRFWIDITTDWIRNDIYIKLDKDGKPLGYIQTGAIS